MKGICSLFTTGYISDDAPASSSLVVRGGGPGDGGDGGHCGDGGYGGHGGDGGDGGYGGHGGDGGDGGYGDHGGGGYDGGHRSHEDCSCYPPALIEVCISGLLDICLL